jgi:hypothetical protein
LFLDVVEYSILFPEKPKELVHPFEAHRPVIFHLVNRITFSIGMNAPQREKFLDIYDTLRIKVASRPERKEKKQYVVIKGRVGIVR